MSQHEGGGPGGPPGSDHGAWGGGGYMRNWAPLVGSEHSESTASCRGDERHFVYLTSSIISLCS